MYRFINLRRHFFSKSPGHTIAIGRYRFTVTGLFLAMALTLVASNVFAIVAPAAGSFAYDVYDIAVTRMLQGPVGFVGGVAAMVIGAVLAIQGKLMGAIPAIIGGAILLRADTLVTSLGAVI